MCQQRNDPFSVSCLSFAFLLIPKCWSSAAYLVCGYAAELQHFGIRRNVGVPLRILNQIRRGGNVTLNIEFPHCRNHLNFYVSISHMKICAHASCVKGVKGDFILLMTIDSKDLLMMALSVTSNQINATRKDFFCVIVMVI